MSLTNESTITVPLKYNWDPNGSDDWYNNSLHLPSFGPEHFDMIKFRMFLYSEPKLNVPKKIKFNLVSKRKLSLNLKYKIIVNFTSNENPIVLENGEYWELSIGKELTFLETDFPSAKSIQCDFELIIPDKFAPPLIKLANDLNELRLNSRFTDVTFVVGKKEFAVNKVILSARSPVLSVMFSREEFVENQQNRVIVTDMDEKVFEALLDFIYTSEVKQLHEIASELLVAAHKYEITALVEMCAKSMIKAITTQNAVNYLLRANMYNLAELKIKVIDFINENSGEIIKSEDWIKHVQPDNSLMIELYRDMAAKQGDCYESYYDDDYS